MDMHQEQSSEVIIPVLEHYAKRWHWSRFRAQNYDNNRNYPQCLIRALTPSEMKTHQDKSSEVIIPVLRHVKLHFGTGRVSVLKKSMIKDPN